MASTPVPGLEEGVGGRLTSPWRTTTEMLFQLGWFGLVERGLQPDWQTGRQTTCGPFLPPSQWLSSCFLTAQSPTY